MRILKKSLLGISSGLLVVSCSTPQTSSDLKSAFLPGPVQQKSVDRSPASTPQAEALSVPYAPPGMPHAGSPAQPPNTGTPPYVPPPAATAPEAPGGCPAPLERIPVQGFRNQFGQPGNVMDLLIGAARGTVTGQRSVDRSILAPYFGGALSLGGELDQVLGESKAWCRAVQFIRGYTSNQCGPTKVADYDINMRMAAVLTAVLVVRNQPECVHLVREQARKILRDNASEIDEAVLPLTAASGYLRDNRLQEKFDEVAKNRQDIEREIVKLDRALAAKEKGMEREVKSAQKQLERDFESLANRMNQIPQCKSSVRFVVGRILPGGDTANVTAQELVDDCKQKLESRLDSLRDREQELKDRYDGFVAARSGSANSVASESERRAEDQLAEVRKKIDEVHGYMDLLSNGENQASIAYLHEKLNTTYARGEAALKSYQTKEYAKADLQTIKTLEQRYLSYSSQYLTLGFFGPLSGLPQR